MHKIFAKTLFLGKKTVSLPQCHSTNEEASKLIAASRETEGTVVTSEYQLAGKGQRGNIWESERGKNVMVSIILNPRFMNPTAQFSLHTISSLAIYDSLFPFLGNKLKIKWPNDIYYGDKKICGILIENSVRGNTIDSSTIGIGLNVNQVVFTTPNTTSLKEIMLEEMDRYDLIENILLHLEKRYLQLKSNKILELRAEYKLKLYRLNQSHLFETDRGKFLGEIKGVDDFGGLLIQDDTEVKSYYFKEVRFVAN